MNQQPTNQGAPADGLPPTAELRRYTASFSKYSSISEIKTGEKRES